jgi:hypothetical protein
MTAAGTARRAEPVDDGTVDRAQPGAGGRGRSGRRHHHDQDPDDQDPDNQDPDNQDPDDQDPADRYPESPPDDGRMADEDEMPAPVREPADESRTTHGPPRTRVGRGSRYVSDDGDVAASARPVRMVSEARRKSAPVGRRFESRAELRIDFVWIWPRGSVTPRRSPIRPA